ncbi:hypothetical protein [Gallaecimonas pentaromativorans]|uniref:hypothetical protein n=1 Tax=Gallaecimonas pentaromativorans TaxID=584787 RepID=UPI003A928EA9
MNKEQSNGVVLALLEQLNDHHIPRLLKLKEKVEEGSRLDDYDLRFLKDAISVAEEEKDLIHQHPELNELAGQLYHLYNLITDQAIVNERDNG